MLHSIKFLPFLFLDYQLSAKALKEIFQSLRKACMNEAHVRTQKGSAEPLYPFIVRQSTHRS